MKIQGLQRDKVISAFRASGRQVEEERQENHVHTLLGISSAKLSL